MNASGPVDTKVLSVRLPIEEAISVDRAAETAGLSRNDYIRMRLKADVSFVEVEGLTYLVHSLRHVEKALDDYLNLLIRLLEITENIDQKDEVIVLISEEIASAEKLMELVFRAQSQTVRAIRVIRGRVDKPLKRKHD